MAAQKSVVQDAARQTLKRILPEGSTVYIQFISCNRMGTSRTHTYMAAVEGDGIWQLDGLLHDAFGWRFRETTHTARGIGTGYDNGESYLSNAMQELYGNSHAWKIVRWQ